MQIILLIIGAIIGFCVGHFMKVSVAQKEVDSALVIKEQQLKDNIKFLNEQNERMMADCSASADTFYAHTMELASYRINEDLETQEKYYQSKVEDYKENYLKSMEDLGQELEEISTTKMNELASIDGKINDSRSILEDLKNKVAATIQSNKIALMEKNKKDFYRCIISDQSANEILQLRKIEPYLQDKRPLCKIIWESYYRNSCNDLLERLTHNTKITGIYKITNLEDNRVYIGQARDIADRLKTHIKAGIGIDPPNNKMYQDMKKLGVENFSFEILEQCLPTQLNEKEKYWIEFYGGQAFGYNMTKGGSKAELI